MHSAQSIYDALRRMDNEIERQIQSVKKQADLVGCDIHDLMDNNGLLVLTPLLAAKASCLNGMASLKAAEVKNQK